MNKTDLSLYSVKQSLRVGIPKPELGNETNRSSTSWRQLTPEQQSDLTCEKAIQLIHNTPTLLKRPVLDTGEQLFVGFRNEYPL